VTFEKFRKFEFFLGKGEGGFRGVLKKKVLSPKKPCNREREFILKKKGGEKAFLFGFPWDFLFFWRGKRGILPA